MNILLADDVEGWLFFHKKNLLEIYEYKKLNIYTFLSAKTAYDFAFCFNENIDLVITDMQMEPMYNQYAGEWLIENLKTLPSTKSSKFIIISSAPNIERIKEKTSADGCLRKGYYNQNPLILKYLLKEIFTDNFEH